MAEDVREEAPRPRVPSDGPFLTAMSVLGGFYLCLIVGMLLADAAYTSLDQLRESLASPNIRHAIKLSLVSCSITALLSLWVAVPLGYLLSRFHFRGKALIDALLDIPIVLPPLVIGLSLLILFRTRAGQALEAVAYKHMGFTVACVLLPLAAGLATWLILKLLKLHGPDGRTSHPAFLLAGIILVIGLTAALMAGTAPGRNLQELFQTYLGTKVIYAVPAVILAQFAVACAFAVRTMRVTFDQIPLRHEQVALTLGCSRSQAFWWVVLPEARRGIITAGTLAWARALGEFGPLLVFAGTTRMRTEVLSTTVFLELSIGSLNAAVAVSLLMVTVAVVVLLIVRLYGMDDLGVKGR